MPRSREIGDYFAIPLLELIPERAIPFDLHIYFEQNRHLMMWKPAGELITAEFLDKYAKRGMQQVWLHHDDAEAYRAYLLPESAPALPEAVTMPEPEAPAGPPLTAAAEIGAEISEALRSEETSEEEKQEQVAEMAQDLLRESAAAETPEAQAKANQELREAVSALLNDMLDGTRETAKAQISEIWQLSEIDPEFEHAVNVSTFAVIFGMAFGRINPDLLADLALAGLLHDVGISQIPAELGAMTWKSFDEGQLATYALHVDFGVQLIKDFGKDIPARVGDIISQHHEKFNGSGYPRSLNGFKVDDISQLLSIADILDSFSTGQFDGASRTLRDTFDMIEKLETSSTFPEYFNPDVFSAVLGWIRSTTSRDARPNAVALVQDQTRQILKKAG